MATLTRTLPPAASSQTQALQLRLEQPAEQMQVVPAFIDRSLITRIAAIVERHKNKTDTLSLRLLEEGEKFKVFSLEPPETPLPLDTNLIAQINRMRSLLRNPFRITDATTLRDPWLVADLVWEKSWLDVFCRAMASFSSKPVIAVRHEFAADTLAWLGTLPVSVFSPPQRVQGIVVNQLGVRTLARARRDLIPQMPTHAQHALEILADYHSLMEMVALERRQEIQIRKLQTMVDFLVVDIEKSDAERDVNLARRDAQVVEALEQIPKAVTELKTEYHSTKQIIEKRMDQAEKNLQESEKLLAKANSEIKSLQASNSNQAYQIACLSGRVGSLENDRNNDRGFGCNLM